MTHFEAIQRLNAGDLVFAYLVGLIEGDSRRQRLGSGWMVFSNQAQMVSMLNMNLELKWVLEMFNYYILSLIYSKILFNPFILEIPSNKYKIVI
jgi:hypothetical protein